MLAPPPKKPSQIWTSHERSVKWIKRYEKVSVYFIFVSDSCSEAFYDNLPLFCELTYVIYSLRMKKSYINHNETAEKALQKLFTKNFKP